MNAAPDSARPLLFLDVDGPLNVFRAYPAGQRYRAPVRSEFTSWQRWELTLDRRHPEMLARLAAEFDICWATAWERCANGSVGHLVGLPELPVVEWGDDKFTGRWGSAPGLHWKTVRLLEYAQGRRFLWLDDECGDADSEYFAAHGADGVALAVDSCAGITEGHVEAALAFAAGRPFASRIVD